MLPTIRRAEASSGIDLATPAGEPLPASNSARRRAARAQAAVGVAAVAPDDPSSEDTDHASSDPVFSDPRQGFAACTTTAATTPTTSVPSTPSAELLADVVRVLRGWTLSALRADEVADGSDVQLRRGLHALDQAVAGPQWPQAYDLLLVGLSRYGEAMPGARVVAAFLRAGAGRRIGGLHAAMQDGTLGAEGVDAGAVLPLLKKLKLDHGSKIRLAQVRASLGEATRAGAELPEAVERLRVTAEVVPDGFVAAQPPAATAASGRAGAPPPAPPGPGPASQIVLPEPERADRTGAQTRPHATLGRPLSVRKTPWRPATEVPGLDYAAPISALHPVGAEASRQGAALVLLGRSFARGGFAKIKPALVLPAGMAHTGALVGDYVARTLGERARVDPLKAHLRGPHWRPPHASAAADLSAEDEALEAAGSEMRPVLTLTDEKENLYQLVPRRDVDLGRAVRRDPLLRQSAPLLHALLRGVLPRLIGLHGADILHHDIKLENLLLDAAGGRVVLADYGLARRRTPAEVVWRGTHGYRPPEMAVLAGAPDRYPYGPRELMPALDLYALAVTVAQLVAPDAFAATPMAYFPWREVAQRRPDLLAEAREQLHRKVGGAAPRKIERRAYGLYVLRESEAYGDWYDENIGQLYAANSAADLQLGHGCFDRLIRAVAEVDLATAQLVARGLHPDPRRRGTAATWTEALRLRGGPTPVLQNVELKRRLLASAAADPHQSAVDRLFAQLRYAASRVPEGGEPSDGVARASGALTKSQRPRGGSVGGGTSGPEGGDQHA